MERERKRERESIENGEMGKSFDLKLNLVSMPACVTAFIYSVII